MINVETQRIKGELAVSGYRHLDKLYVGGVLTCNAITVWEPGKRYIYGIVNKDSYNIEPGNEIAIGVDFRFPDWSGIEITKTNPVIFVNKNLLDFSLKNRDIVTHYVVNQMFNLNSNIEGFGKEINVPENFIDETDKLIDTVISRLRSNGWFGKKKHANSLLLR